MNAINEQIIHGQILLNANIALDGSDEVLIEKFVEIGPAAMSRIKDEITLFVEEKLHAKFMRDKCDLDAAVVEYQEWIEVNYYSIGDKYFHQGEMYALEDVVLEMSCEFIGEEVEEHDIPDKIERKLAALRQRLELMSMVCAIKKPETQPRKM